MRLAEALVVEVRDATTGSVVGAGTVTREPAGLERLFGRVEARFVGSALQHSGVAIIIRCPA